MGIRPSLCKQKNAVFAQKKLIKEKCIKLLLSETPRLETTKIIGQPTTISIELFNFCDVSKNFQSLSSLFYKKYLTIYGNGTTLCANLPQSGNSTSQSPRPWLPRSSSSYSPHLTFKADLQVRVVDKKHHRKI